MALRAQVAHEAQVRERVALQEGRDLLEQEEVGRVREVVVVVERERVVRVRLVNIERRDWVLEEPRVDVPDTDEFDAWMRGKENMGCDPIWALPMPLCIGGADELA